MHKITMNVSISSYIDFFMAIEHDKKNISLQKKYETFITFYNKYKANIDLMNSLQNINSTKQQISVFYYSEIEEVFACMHLMIEKKANREINIFTDSDQNQSFALLQDSLASLWPCLVYTQNYIILDDPVRIHKIDQADKKKLEEELGLTEKTIIPDSITMCPTPMRYNEKKHRWEYM